MESARPRRGVARYVLSSVQVLDIYRLKTQGDGLTKSKTSASSIAKIFGISSKTVRDIWNGRTWYRTTNHLEPNKGDAAKRMQRHAGRPKGSKDSKPRVRRQRPNMSVPLDTETSSRVAATTSHAHNTHTYDVKGSPCASLKRTLFDHGFQPTFDLDGHASSFVDPFHEDWQEWLKILKKQDQ